jgi:signal peptidase
MHLIRSSAVRRGVRDVAIVGIGVLIFWFALQVVFGTANPFYVVSSGSMVPALKTYDILIVQANDPFESVRLGDIIVFDRPTGTDRVIVHRVISIINDDPYTLRTKGDANSASIPGTDFPITEEEYLGKVEFIIPQVGLVTQAFAPPINYIIIVIIIGALIFKQFRKRDTNRSDPGTPETDAEPQDTAYAAGSDVVGADAAEPQDASPDENRGAESNKPKSND